MSFASSFLQVLLPMKNVCLADSESFFLSHGQSTGVSRSLHLYLSCRQMVWIIIWCLRKTDMPTTTWRDITMEWKGPGAGHRGGTRYVGDENVQITTWLSSWEKGRSVSLTLGKVFFPRVVLEGCFRTPLRSNSDSVRWKNVTAFTVLDRRRPIKAATSIGPQSCVSQTSDSWVILFKRLFEVNRFDGTDKDFESQNTCGFFSCSFDY